MLRSSTKFATVLRRGLSTKQLLPPNLASRSAVDTTVRSAAAESQTLAPGNMAELVRFYKNVPKGNAPASRPTGPGNLSYKPLAQVIVAIGLLGYFIDYQFHLKHHKNVEHH
ncbi:hypothetical protein THASP1DRAFT_13770 [Thamnocephalis sphaerospora]|uniref:Mitochondrial F1-F0 ATP synthase subunit F of fungi-domain-containing protein n=1 Tax=Thamnocephalis sphaerospora TaxID=78915 RepID=A0A4P9XUA5_9FUNG|nr:hypothetical protein THASP1DRAFT_13770 [Thamnocephalis sphaerospora]|eukprot:RKP09804.1 hypothetical protein THASP1DRAFT_13770 [Thamnocephalis sphaerospora]